MSFSTDVKTAISSSEGRGNHGVKQSFVIEWEIMSENLISSASILAVQLIYLLDNFTWC